MKIEISINGIEETVLATFSVIGVFCSLLGLGWVCGYLLHHLKFI